MATETRAIKNKRPREDNKKVEEPQKIKKKRKVAENDVCQHQKKAKILSKEKKPHLSTAVFGKDCKISYDQLYQFLKYSTLGKHHCASQSSWCHIHHQRCLAGVAVAVLRDVGQLHFYRFYMQFRYLRKTFRQRFSLPPVSGDFMEKLCGAGAKIRQRVDKQARAKEPIIQKYGEKRHGLTSYLLTPKEMCLHDYPQADDDSCSHFVHTGCNSPATDSSPLFGLDCEMCLTSKGSELTRISVVDASGRCIMNELVKPKLPISDYLTSYSGITKELLLPVTTTLADIQGRLKRLLPADAVLVGHSLNFDLRALEMVHPRVIDTSLLFARKDGKRFKLKFLAEAVLGKKIQQEDGQGHDPTEDARCALELAQYFIGQGPKKVAELNLEIKLLEQRNAPKQKNRVQKHVQNPTQCLLDILHSMGQKTLLLGGPHEAPSSNCQNHLDPLNKHIFQRALDKIPRASFSLIQFDLDSKLVTSDLTAEMCSKMRAKLVDLLTVYAGPFGQDVCLKSLKRTFKKYGHVQSIRFITETAEPHICTQYEVLEAAQLAMGSLNGTVVEGSLIKVQRPVTELTLDCEGLVKELESDPENEGVVYLAGLRKMEKETDLQEKLSYLTDLSSVFQPRDPSTGKKRNYCFLRVHASLKDSCLMTHECSI
ncbi:RNA exonuclease 5 isoform X3 [Varanus komodoensis]|uniref:RNA exonuclease 5 isoform X3 n=1 Tax=Varanus komodoensis TaxID=61221 RepID=UPI001CF7AEDB|nr:RNA exonuclease 5 isoform X3 [Varanus komodoensis]